VNDDDDDDECTRTSHVLSGILTHGLNVQAIKAYASDRAESRPNMLLIIKSVISPADSLKYVHFHGLQYQVIKWCHTHEFDCTLVIKTQHCLSIVHILIHPSLTIQMDVSYRSSFPFLFLHFCTEK
jgi:hypothetical protein